MLLLLEDNLLFVTITAVYQGASVDIPHVLVDTGSASTILAADSVTQLGVFPEPLDMIQTIQGVGGVEFVYSRHIDRLLVGEQGIDNFQIEVGGMDYGFAINGILGMDFLIQTKAIIDIDKLQLEFANKDQSQGESS